MALLHSLVGVLRVKNRGHKKEGVTLRHCHLMHQKIHLIFHKSIFSPPYLDHLKVAHEIQRVGMLLEPLHTRD